MSRSVRAETRQSKKDESKKHHGASNLFSARKWEKKWVTICDTTMRIYKWVPVNCSGNEAKKTLKPLESSQNDKENSKIPRNDEDSSNTCFSFSEIQFQNNSSDKFLFSEDSNSQSSDTIPVKKFKSND